MAREGFAGSGVVEARGGERFSRDMDEGVHICGKEARLVMYPLSI